MEENKNFDSNEKIREQNAENRLIRRETAETEANRDKDGKGKTKRAWWIATVVCLSTAVVILGSLLAYKVFTPSAMGFTTTSSKEEQSFYELVGNVSQMDVNLSKLVVSKDDGKRQKLLGEVRVESSLATENLSALALQDEDKYYTLKFINQVGDFCKYLNEKLIDGETLSSSDIKTLKSMQEINASLKQRLYELSINLDEGYEFKSLLEGREGDVIISNFKDLETLSTEYPHMIYDGAFSDGTEGRVAKYLEGKEEVSKMKAEELFKQYFSSYGVKNVELVGESAGEIIETYNLEGTDNDGVTISAQISKKGGKLVEFNYFKECSEDKIDLATSREVAEKFLEKVGYTGLRAVWTTSGGNVVTINYASVSNGIICYPDLIKVNVCRERGVVSGIEASSYIYNHAERENQTASVSLATARAKVDEEISVESSRLAIIPKGESKETLAYEFYGKSDGSYYYIYIDASNGRDIDIFKVIETTEGTLLA